MHYDYIFKYILVGNSSAGKSSLLSMFLSNHFTGESNPTMGVEFATKKVRVKDTNIKLQIWDTVKLLLRRQDRNLSEQLPELTIKMPLGSFYYTI